MALALILIVAVAAVAYGFFAVGTFTLAYVFDAVFFVGALVLLAGLLGLAMPTMLRRSKLHDHSTFAKRHFDAREEKRAKSHDVLSVGLWMVFLAGVIQAVLSFVIRG